jgi:hypothetical protein
MTEIESRLHELHHVLGLAMRVDAAMMSDAASGQLAMPVPVMTNHVLGVPVLAVHGDARTGGGEGRGFAAPAPAVPNHELEVPMLAGHAGAEIGGAASRGAKGIKGACGREWPYPSRRHGLAHGGDAPRRCDEKTPFRWCHDDKPDVADAGGVVPRSLSKGAGVSSTARDEHSSMPAHDGHSFSIDAAADGGQAEVTQWLVTFAAQVLKHWRDVSAAAHQEPKDMQVPMSDCVGRLGLADMSDGVCGLGVVSMPIVC